MPNVYEKLPTETIDQYYARLPGSAPGSPTTGISRPFIDQPNKNAPQVTTAPLNTPATTSAPSLYSNSTVDTARAITTDIAPYDENKRRQDLIAQQEASFKAINDIYNRRVQDEQAFGQRDLARANTISALSGLAGSPEATTHAGAADRRTEDRVAKVNELRALEIQKIYGQIDANIQREKELSLQTSRENAKNILDEVSKNADSALQSLAQSGIQWDTFKANDPEALNNLIRQTGKSEYELKSKYISALPEQYRPVTYTDYKDNGDGTTTMVKVSFDPLTKKTSTDNYVVKAPISMFKAAEKPLEVGGKLLVKQPDGSYKDVAPHTPEEIAKQKADIAYTQSQTAKNYQDITNSKNKSITTTKIGGQTVDNSNGAYSNMQIIDDILQDPGAISGLVQTGSIPFTAGAGIANKYDQLKGILSLANRQQLKGSGAISDFESRTLEKASSALGRNQNEEDFAKELKKIRGVFANSAGLPTVVEITDPRTGDKQTIHATREGINQAISDGLLVEYK